MPRIIGGRYGLGSKEFTPAMVKSVFDEMIKPQPGNHFSVGIIDDVTFASLPFDQDFKTEPAGQVRALFWGLGADGTVSANKNSIKIIGEETPNYAQGYFVYDSKKSGAMTVSHLRFGPQPIKSTYLIQRANFIAVHQFNFLDRYQILDAAEEGATLLLNSPYEADQVWEHLARSVQEMIIARKIKVYSINAYAVAKDNQLGNRINTIMQTCFFAISGVLPRDEAIVKIKESIRKTYGKRGEPVVRQNFAAVDAALAHLYEVVIPSPNGRGVRGEGAELSATKPSPNPLPKGEGEMPDFVRNVTLEIMSGRGDLLPVSAFPVDGTYPVATAQWEKRNIALEVPVWETDLCIECGKCVLVCPHSTIRAKVVQQSDLTSAPEGFKTMPAKWRELPDQLYNFLKLPDIHRNGKLTFTSVKDVQLLQPLFEFSGACSGCGETPYIKLMTQLFGDRAIIANATGCSSIYGGNLPTTPYTINREGRGPAWSNSLFEDNAEFGLGMRLAIDHQNAYAIGYGGLDHVLASGQDVNILVLDTEVYSNTGGQASKATPLGAVAKFAAGGKPTIKKDLGMTAMRYGDVYIAQVAMGASDTQTLKAFLEAEAHPGPSLIIAYSQCIAHGIDMAKGMHQQKLAVESGHWPLYRFNPKLENEGKNPFVLDSHDPKIPLQDYIYTEGRYRMLQRSDPESAKVLLEHAQQSVNHRWRQYKQLALQNPKP